MYEGFPICVEMVGGVSPGFTSQSVHAGRITDYRLGGTVDGLHANRMRLQEGGHMMGEATAVVCRRKDSHR